MGGLTGDPRDSGGTVGRADQPIRPEVWAGPECSFLTIGDRLCDQLH